MLREVREAPYLISKIAALTTDALLVRLRALGLTVTTDRFAAETADLDSAWTLGERWCERVDTSLEAARRDPVWTDLVCLAACELWKRWQPERPSDEMLEDLIQVGLEADREEDFATTCEHWLKVWGLLVARVTPGRPFILPPSFYDWLFELGPSFLAASMDAPEYIDKGIALLRDVLARLPDTDAGIHAELGFYVIELLLADDRLDEALAVAHARAEAAPQHISGHVWAISILKESGQAGQALTAMRTLMQQDLEGAEDWDLEGLLAELETLAARS